MLRTMTAVVATIALGGLTACGGDQDSGGGGLSDALDSVSSGPASEQYFAFTDVAALREVTDLPRPGERVDDVREAMRWSVPSTLGSPVLTQSSREGVDVYSADRLMTIGTGGDMATRVDGLDGDAAVLTRTADISSADDGTVVLASSEETRDAMLGDGGDALGDRAEYAAAADCLGDVVAAALLPGKTAGGDVQLVAIGVRGGDDPVEVLCAVGDGDQAERAADALRAHLDPDATEGVTRRRLADLIGDAQVDTGDGDGRDWARVVVTPKEDARLGFLIQAALVQRQLEEWLS